MTGKYYREIFLNFHQLQVANNKYKTYGYKIGLILLLTTCK